MKADLFFKHIGRLLFLNVLLKPLWIFAVDRQVQNLTGHAAYGVYFSLLNLSLVFAFMTDAGLSAMAARQVAAGTLLNAAQLMRVKGVLALVYAGLVAIVAWLAGADGWPIILLVCAIQVALSFVTFFRSLLTAHQFFGIDSWLSVVDKALMLAFFLPLLYTTLFQKPITLLFFLRAQLACTLITATIALLIILHKQLLHANAPRLKLAALLTTTAPFALIILTMTAHNRLDGFLLERLHPNGAYEAGVYAASYRLLDAANMPGYLVASFLVPFIARQQQNKLMVQQTVLIARFGLLLCGGLLALLCVIYARPIQLLLYPNTLPYAARVLQWCLPVLPAYFLLHVYGSLLTALGWLRLLIAFVTAGVALNILLNALLIPHFGAFGCCIAALVSQYSCALAVYYFATQQYKMVHAGTQWLCTLASLLLAGVILYASFQLGLPLLWAVTGAGAIAMLALFAYLPLVKNFFRLS